MFSVFLFYFCHLSIFVTFCIGSRMSILFSWNQCHCYILQKVAFIIHSESEFRATTTHSVRTNQTIVSGWVYIVDVFEIVYIFRSVIIVSMNLYWQLGEFLNSLSVLSSVSKDEPMEPKKKTTSENDASFRNVELSAKIKPNIDTASSSPLPLLFFSSVSSCYTIWNRNC